MSEMVYVISACDEEAKERRRAALYKDEYAA